LNIFSDSCQGKNYHCSSLAANYLSISPTGESGRIYFSTSEPLFCEFFIVNPWKSNFQSQIPFHYQILAVNDIPSALSWDYWEWILPGDSLPYSRTLTLCTSAKSNLVFQSFHKFWNNFWMISHLQGYDPFIVPRRISHDIGKISIQKNQWKGQIYFWLLLLSDTEYLAVRI